MADYFQGGIFESLWNSTKRDGFQGMTISGAFAPVSCSSTMADSCSGSGTFNWAAIEIDDGKTWSTEEPASSASGSTTTFQDTQNTQFPNHIPNFSPSPYSMDWTQALISNTGRDETNFHSVLQEDNNWRPTILQEPSILSSNQDINTFPLKPASCGYPSSLYESVDSQIKGSIYDTWSMNAQQSMIGYHGSPGELPHPSWNISAAPAQRFEQKSNSSNQTMQSNKKSVRDSSSSSTKKGSGRCMESPQKKPRIDMPSPLPTFKVRKEKLGDRITALQQLVSPFGKTDTASVLHETIDYIKFLHDQVSVLSNPYLNTMQYQQNQDNSSDGDGPKQDLRSRGLCLVPITSTFPVVSENSVDAWTSTFGGIYSNRRAKTSFFAMLQEDLSSRPFFRQEASIYSDQVQPIEENSMVNPFKDTSESLLENHRLSSDIEVNCGINNLPLRLGTYGCPSMTQQGQLKLISNSQQSVYDSQSVNYRSKAMVIGQA